MHSRPHCQKDKETSIAKIAVVQQTGLFDGNLYYTSENIVLFFTDNYFYCSDRRVFRIPGAVSVNAFPLYNNFDYIIEAKDNEQKHQPILV